MWHGRIAFEERNPYKSADAERRLLIYKLGLQFLNVKQDLQHTGLKQGGSSRVVLYYLYPIKLLLNGLLELQVCIFMLSG